MANAEPRRISSLRLLVLVLALILLVLGIIGALVTLYAPGDQSALEPGKDAPHIRQMERDSLRRDGRAAGH